MIVFSYHKDAHPAGLARRQLAWNDRARLARGRWRRVRSRRSTSRRAKTPEPRDDLQASGGVGRTGAMTIERGAARAVCARRLSRARRRRRRRRRRLRVMWTTTRRRRRSRSHREYAKDACAEARLRQPIDARKRRARVDELVAEEEAAEKTTARRTATHRPPRPRTRTRYARRRRSARRWTDADADAPRASARKNRD